ncbi:MAG: hypothetical protein ACUVSX_15500 [Aggregatilineales bacterium]
MAVSVINENNRVQQQMLEQRVTQWEYLTLTYNYSYGSTTYELNGEKETRLKNTALHTALSLLGRQGWELVSIAGAEAKLYVFKRPVHASTAT